MSKRKLDEFKDGSEFKFWGMVISRFIWGYSRSIVSKKFDCSETYVTKVMKKVEEDGGYIDYRQFNKPQFTKLKPEAEKILVKTIKKKPNSSAIQLQDKLVDKGI